MIATAREVPAELSLKQETSENVVTMILSLIFSKVDGRKLLAAEPKIIPLSRLSRIADALFRFPRCGSVHRNHELNPIAMQKSSMPMVNIFFHLKAAWQMLPIFCCTKFPAILHLVPSPS